MSAKNTFFNNLKLIIFSVILGMVAGAVIWSFLKAVGFFTEVIWEDLREQIDYKWYAVIVCTIGGLIIGFFRKSFGDYPEELVTIMSKVKKEGHYDYSHMLVILVAAFLPLVFGASIGPEAGLTGVIVGLCYWVGDNVKYAKANEKEYSEIGEAVTLGVLFHVPLFGIFAVEEELAGEEAGQISLPKPVKLLLYGGAIAGGLLAYDGLSHFFGVAMEGFPSFDTVSMEAYDYLAMAVYVLAGVVLAYIFVVCEYVCERIYSLLPAVVGETLGGLVLGVIITFVPMVAFSGEEQMGQMAEDYTLYLPVAFAVIALIKVFLTTFCIKMGMKGGHFFPLIFACACMGFAVGIPFFGYDLGHLVFAAGTVTAACLGAQMKKPIAVALLCLLCFPVKMLFFIFLAAAIGAGIAGMGDKEKPVEEKGEN